MTEKEVESRNKFQTTLLVVTSTLFLLFTTIFFISINYFEAIQLRIAKLIELTNYKDSRYEIALEEFIQAENNFRLYCIDLSPEHYQSYENKIKKLSTSITQILASHKTDSAKSLSESNSILAHNKYLSLDSKIIEIIALSSITDSLHRLLRNHTLIQPPSTQKLNLNVDEFVVKPKADDKSLWSPLHKKLNQKKIDENAIKTYNKAVSDFSVTNSEHFNNFKTRYEVIRKNEREFLSTHFSLLYSIHQILLEINDSQSVKQNKLLQLEHEDLLEQTSKLTWQTILCLIFIFILIFVMIYYQFRNRYYENQLIEEKRYAAKLASEKSDILAEISHEIRTPINSLIGIIDLLRKRSNMYAEKEKLFLDTAYSNISNTSRTINDILNLSKIDYNANLDLHDFDIEDLVNDIYQIHKSQAEIKNIELEVTIDEAAPTIIHSDELKMRQILTNLISNGIKYTMNGKVSCHIKINDLNNLHIKIVDSGLGIPEGMQPNIFKKYFTRNDEQKLSNGIGLGLYITKRLIQKLNGHITFTSKENLGTTFTVEIPIPQAKTKIKTTGDYKLLTEFPNDVSWLLVDDNILNILYLKQFFQTFEQVKTATNGLEAVEILKNYIPDLIITDINMPIMTGDELLVYIRQAPELRHTKIIATSSDYDQIKELERKRNTFFDNVIIKPFNEKDLVKIINQTITKSNTSH